MNVLVVNCGSSSIKFVLTHMPDNKILAKGIVEKLGMPDSFIKYSTTKIETTIEEVDIPNHTKGVEIILEKLTHPNNGCIHSLQEVDAVGHRLVHGGEKFAASCVMDQSVLEQLKACIPLAPLHNPANIMGIEAVTNVLPTVKQVGVFDTAFHQTMPEHAYLYPLPYELYKEYGIRRYGFHGTSHLYVSQKAAKLCGVDINKSKIITCHIGNGASMTAIENGKSVDTSMGLTPTEGLMMGTRCGDIDCGIPSFLLDNAAWRKDALDKYLDAKTIDKITKEEEAKGSSKEDIKIRLYSVALGKLFNNHSGLKGVGCIGSSDMRDMQAADARGEHLAHLALEIYNYRIRKYIGAYAAVMDGCDIIVFTAGVGENNRDLRKDVCRHLSFMGVSLDESLNDQPAKDMIISKPDSKVKVVVIQTDEEYMIAKDTYELVR